MKRLIILIPFLLFIAPLSFSQRCFYLDPLNGSDSNSGIYPSSAFQSVLVATQIVEPGDTIVLMGMFKNYSYSDTYTYKKENDPILWNQENTIRINNLHGSPNAYITIKSYDENNILKGNGNNILRIVNSSYLRIESLNIEGEVKHIPLLTAQKLQFSYLDALHTLDVYHPTLKEIRHRDQDCIANCIADSVAPEERYKDLSNTEVVRPSYIDTRGMYLSDVHHIDILNNKVHHMPGTGVRVSKCEDINIIGNEVYACSRKSYSGTHALVVTKAQSTRNTNDYRIKIIRNRVHHNYNEQFSWAQTKTIITPKIDEGKGISLERNQTTYNEDGTIKRDWQHGRILIANNLCYYNGFSGINNHDGNRVDIINNTVYMNSYTKSFYEHTTNTQNGGNIGISARGGKDVHIINNISVIDYRLHKSAISSNLSVSDRLVVKNNIIYGTTLLGKGKNIKEDQSVVKIQQNTWKKDPMFKAPLHIDFSLQPSSPAIGKANKKWAPTTDFYGNKRDSSPDLGAIEYIP